MLSALALTTLTREILTTLILFTTLNRIPGGVEIVGGNREKYMEVFSDFRGVRASINVKLFDMFSTVVGAILGVIFVPFPGFFRSQALLAGRSVFLRRPKRNRIFGAKTFCLPHTNV